MCDYSLHAVATRPAEVGETIVTTTFRGTSTRGFASEADMSVAVCLLHAHRNPEHERCVGPIEQRVQTAVRFASAVMAYGDKSPDPKEPKLLVLQKLIDQCLPAYKQEMDPEIAAAIALGLGQLHLQAHAIIKPDDNAADRTIAPAAQTIPPTTSCRASPRVSYSTPSAL